ncbi:MAG TPA: hypothetical protein VFF59_10095 [Anaerolineae bacterium]|nr:hypothetical protein [Anaerolineae bacterium]
MSDARPPAPHKQTPRIPSNVLYNRIVPIAIGIMVIMLVIVIGAVILGVGTAY